MQLYRSIASHIFTNYRTNSLVVVTEQLQGFWALAHDHCIILNVTTPLKPNQSFNLGDGKVASASPETKQQTTRNPSRPDRRSSIRLSSAAAARRTAIFQYCSGLNDWIWSCRSTQKPSVGV